MVKTGNLEGHQSFDKHTSAASDFKFNLNRYFGLFFFCLPQIFESSSLVLITEVKTASIPEDIYLKFFFANLNLF